MRKLLLFVGTAMVVTQPALAGTSESGASEAESPGGGADSADGEILVTARKRSERLQDVPVSITYADGETLARSGVQSFRDFAIGNPNVKIEQVASSAIAVNVAIRGNVQSAGTLQVDPSVGTYIDGYLISHNFGTAGMDTDVASVQTLKGPQGTLFGRNTTGGAILITTVDPVLKETSGYVQAGLGSLETRRYGGAINIPLGEIAALRLVYQKNSNGHYQFFTNGTQLGRHESELLRAKLLVQPTETTTMVFTAEKANELVNATADTPTHPNAPRYQNVPVLPGPGGNGTVPVDARTNGELATFKGERYGVTVTQEVPSGAVKLIVGRRDYDITSAQSISPGLGFTFQNKPNNHDTTAELQYNGHLLDDRLDVAAGLFYFNETIHEDQDTFLYSGTQRSNRLLTAKSISKSAYLQLTGKLTDQLRLTGGIRYTDDKKTGVLNTSTLSGTTVGTRAASLANPQATFRSTNGRANYLVSVDYRPMKDVMLYASHATGYRAGGTGTERVAENQPANPGYLQTTFFLPESVKNYEAGFKTQLFDRMLTFNGAAFYQDYSNYQYSITDVNTLLRATKNSGATIKGFELESYLHLPTGTTLSATYGYTDGRVKDNTSAADGSKLPYVSRVTYSLGLSQNIPFDSGDINFNANYSWRSGFFTNLNDPLVAGNEELNSQVDSRGVLNLSATLRTGPYSLSVYANNVTNNNTYTYVFNSGTALNFGGVTKPRVIGVNGKFEF